MYDDITIEERIDNYLLGRMSDEEKRLFEADLERDPELKEDFENQKQVANAVQKVAMRDFLEKHAEERQLAKRNAFELSEVFSRFSDWVKDYFSSGQRVVWAFATVAAMVVAVVGGINYSSTVRSFENSGMLAYAELAAPIARDGNQVDVLIGKAYEQIGNVDYDGALATIGEVRNLINSSLEEEAVSEEECYEHEVLQMKLYDLEWYEAIVLMRQGRILKANKALKAISTSDSPYADAARNELNALFH
jgi:hypothetical protein